MYKRQDYCQSNIHYLVPNGSGGFADTDLGNLGAASVISFCLLYKSDAADERSSVDLGGRRIIKKKKLIT